MTDPKPGLYVHVPFCSSKCPYCDFYSINAPKLISKWLAGVQRESQLYKGDFQSFNTLYLGGGTPSVLSPETLAELLVILKSSFNIEPKSEITIEVNPEDATHDYIEAMLKAGVNRVSLGVQSFRDEELTFLGRRHDAARAEKAARIIREAGCDNLGLDLMFALPGQTMQDWMFTLKKGVSLQPEHLSCYGLTIERGTKFAAMAERGEFIPASEETFSNMFIRTSEYLEQAGYEHYEISNYSKGPAGRSRHNQKYWFHTPYLGLGPSAHSFNNGTRWWNERSVKKYCSALEQNRTPVSGRESLTDEQLELETIFLGLRTNKGINLNLALSQPSGSQKVEKWQADSLAEIKDQKLILTRKGMVFADRLAEMLYGE